MMNTQSTNTTCIIPYSFFTRGGEIKGLDAKSDFIRVLCGSRVPRSDVHRLATVSWVVQRDNASWRVELLIVIFLAALSSVSMAAGLRGYTMLHGRQSL
jgi:hypothetical protein